MKNNFSEVSFYNLTTLPIEKAALKLIEKIYYTNQRLVVIAENEKLMRSIDDGLWAYSTKHFIPHGTYNDEHPSDQPVYLTTKLENPNNASIVIGLGAVDLEQFETTKYIHMFDGNEQAQLSFAKNKQILYQKHGHNIIYWQQNIAGNWEKRN